MTINNYNLSSSLSRFSDNKNWQKILFRNDKKLQTTEIEELQSILNNQISKAFSFLYNFYSIVKGCRIFIINITSSNYECILTEGKVYIELKNKEGIFIDTPSHTFTINRSNSTEVGILFNLLLLEDEDILNNPHTGGAAFGSKGSNRFLINPTIIIQPKNIPSTTGFYPIAIIKPKSLNYITTNNDISDGTPDILYYQNEELTKIYNENKISTYIKNLIELRFYESCGDFISRGFDCSINTTTKSLCISPGVAYIKGKKIESNYNNYFEIDPYQITNQNIVLQKQYLFYLNEKGYINYVSQNVNEVYLPEIPSNSIGLCYIIINNIDNLSLNYSLITIPNKIPSVNELIDLKKTNEENIKDLSQLLLKIDLLNLSKNNLNKDLNGIFTDSFNDLDNTDIFYPTFKASILPAIQAISLPFTSNVKDNRTYTIDTSNSNIIVESIINENNELVPYWSTINGSNSKLFNGALNITNYITIPNTISNKVNVICTPSILYKSDETTFINYTNPSIKYLAGTTKITNINTPINKNTYTKTINVKATGFLSNQDNIQVNINNIPLTSINIVKGSQGNLINTIKANSNGAIHFYFTLPVLKDIEDTINVSLVINNIEHNSQIKIIDPEIERINRENNIDFIQSEIECSEVINSGLLQIFQTTEPLMIKGVECTISDYPNIQEEDILHVQLVTINSNNKPVNVIGQGSITAAQLSPLNNNLTLINSSTINLNKMVNLTRGKYGIIFTTSLTGVKIGITNANANRLKDGKNFYYDPLKLEVLKYINDWVLDKDIDNVACNIITHKPLSLTSTTIINIENEADNLFNVLDINMSIHKDTNSVINSYVLNNNNNQYELITNGNYFFRNPTNKTKLRIDMQGTNNTHPVINLDNLSINLLKTENKTIWISKNQEYESPYTSLSLSIDIYKPNNTTFKFYFSSNKGVSWEELTDPIIEIVNNTLPINKYNFKKTDLGFTVVNNESSLRYNLRYKIEIEVDKIEGINPFFKNLVSITNA